MARRPSRASGFVQALPWLVIAVVFLVFWFGGVAGRATGQAQSASEVEPLGTEPADELQEGGQEAVQDGLLDRLGTGSLEHDSWRSTEEWWAGFMGDGTWVVFERIGSTLMM